MAWPRLMRIVGETDAHYEAVGGWWGDLTIEQTLLEECAGGYCAIWWTVWEETNRHDL